MAAPASRALATVEAVHLLRRLHDQHGALMFHQSGGCCDGSAPMCYPAGDFIVGDADVLLGRIDLGKYYEPVPVWISGPQFAAWKHTRLVIDVVPGRGAGFSLESPTGQRFLTRSFVLTAEEQDALPTLTGAEVEAGVRLPAAHGPVTAQELGEEVCEIG